MLLSLQMGLSCDHWLCPFMCIQSLVWQGYVKDHVNGFHGGWAAGAAGVSVASLVRLHLNEFWWAVGYSPISQASREPSQGQANRSQRCTVGVCGRSGRETEWEGRCINNWLQLQLSGPNLTFLVSPSKLTQMVTILPFPPSNTFVFPNKFFEIFSPM